MRKRKADEAVATEAARVEKANRERVTRSAAVGKLDREIGRGNGRLDALKEFVGGWEKSNPVGWLSGTPRWRVFDVDVRYGQLAYCEFPPPLSVKGFPDCKAADDVAVEFDHLPRPGEPISPRYGGPRLTSNAAVNSITFSACKKIVLTTWADPPRGHNVSLTRAFPALGGAYNPFLCSRGPKVRRRTVHNSWCCGNCD